MRRLVLTALLLASTAWAADMMPPPEIKPAAADPLATPRRLIAARDWAGALAALRAQPQAGSADWHNLMGYTLRKQATPQLAEAEAQYLEALRIAPGHRGANEYLGELYVMKGDLPKARERLAVLEKLCPAGCEEREDLQKAIAGAGK
ncbi:MAG TPA: tetratricopeptide repeat protein [Roseateles sp.]